MSRMTLLRRRRKAQASATASTSASTAISAPSHSALPTATIQNTDDQLVPNTSSSDGDENTNTASTDEVAMDEGGKDNVAVHIDEEDQEVPEGDVRSLHS